MDRFVLFAVLICAALVACEPRGTPQKPKTTLAQLDAERAADHFASVAVGGN